MHSATKEVDTGVTLSKKADASLKQIVTSVENVMEMVGEICFCSKTAKLYRRRCFYKFRK